MFTKTLFVLSAFALSVSGLSVHHGARSIHHRAIAARAAAPEPVPVAAVAGERRVEARKRRRGLSGRCVAQSSSAVASSTVIASTTAQAATSSLVPVGNPEAAPTSTTEAAPTPTPTTEAAPTSTTEAAPATTEAPKTTETPATTATPTSTAASSDGNTPSYLIGTQSGDGTFYAIGLGACGITNSGTDRIAAVSHLLFDTFPNYNGVNPNSNPVCNRKVTANYQGRSTTVLITDRCTGCAITDLDFSPTAFSDLADFSVGRIHGVTWTWD